jgi:hypothetical protein
MCSSPPRGGTAQLSPLVEFAPLVAQLDTMRSQGRRIRMWWRDDDSYRDTTELRRLLMARRNIPIALAVIPGLLDETLTNLIHDSNRVSVLQHGWKHIDWSGGKSRPSEFPDSRSTFEVSEQLRSGRELLEKTFGSRFHPVLVPPWHSISRWLLENFGDLGYLAVSNEAPLFPLLSRGWGREINIEIDTSDWTRQGAFIGSREVARRLLRAFELRQKWNSESFPIGILTHHAVLTPSDCDSLGSFICMLEEVGCVEWLSVKGMLDGEL